jgi:hypothetical protein
VQLPVLEIPDGKSMHPIRTYTRLRYLAVGAKHGAGDAQTYSMLCLIPRSYGPTFGLSVEWEARAVSGQANREAERFQL